MAMICVVEHKFAKQKQMLALVGCTQNGAKEIFGLHPEFLELKDLPMRGYGDRKRYIAGNFKTKS